MNKNLRAPILAVLGIASLAVAVPLSVAKAQDQPPRPERIQRAGGPGDNSLIQGRPDAGMMQRMGPGGAPVMIDDAQNLYILAGNRLFKVDKSSFDVVAEGMLPTGQPPRGGFEGTPPPFEGQPGIRRGGGGGGELPLPGDPIPPTE